MYLLDIQYVATKCLYCLQGVIWSDALFFSELWLNMYQTFTWWISQNIWISAKFDTPDILWAPWSKYLGYWFKNIKFIRFNYWYDMNERFTVRLQLFKLMYGDPLERRHITLLELLKLQKHAVVQWCARVEGLPSQTIFDKLAEAAESTLTTTDKSNFGLISSYSGN